MTFGIFVLLLLVDFYVSSFCGNPGFSFATYRYVPVLIFNGSGPALCLGRSTLFKKVPVSDEEPTLYIHKCVQLSTSPRAN
jgi:hypothetical protein